MPAKTLTLPRSAIATLSPSPFLTAHLISKASIRSNGRQVTEFRPVACNTSSLSHCAGSAVVRVGDTAVVCGIQAEILLARDIPSPAHDARGRSGRDGEVARLNLVAPNVELATGCSPAHLPGTGGPPGQEAQALSARLLSLLLSSDLVSADDLRITRTVKVDEEDESSEEVEETVAYWTLYPSVHVMSLSGSASLFDAAWGALLTALRDTRLPKAWWSQDLDTVLCSDRTSESRKLNLSGRPIAVTWGVFEAGAQETQAAASQNGVDVNTCGKAVADAGRAWLLADPDWFENDLCDETITMVIDCNNPAGGISPRIFSVEKSGGRVISLPDIQQLLPQAQSRWKEWTTAIP